jgi:hypothetical protein
MRLLEFVASRVQTSKDNISLSCRSLSTPITAATTMHAATSSNTSENADVSIEQLGLGKRELFIASYC